MAKQLPNSVVQIPGCLPKGYSMDSILNEGQCQAWLQLEVADFSKKVRDQKIPCLDFGAAKRFHPRAVLAAQVGRGGKAVAA